MVNRETPYDPYREPSERIRSAREKIGEIIRSLDDVSTSSVDQYADTLAEAARELQSAASLIQGTAVPGDAALRKEIHQLRRELKVLSMALGESDRLVSSWMGRIGGRSGYTERGASAPLILVRKVNITG